MKVRTLTADIISSHRKGRMVAGVYDRWNNLGDVVIAFGGTTLDLKHALAGYVIKSETSAQREEHSCYDTV